MSDIPDDDLTIIGPAAVPAAASPAPLPMGERGSSALAVGTRLGEFEILSVLGIGGFGIVYLAYDDSLERKVALKEYMPSSLAARSATMQVSVVGAQHRETFDAGLRSFVNEARILAQFDHPALIKVYRFWEANGTAYMVMPFYQGRTLKQMLAERRQAGLPPLDEAALKTLLAPLLDTLSLIHEQHCFHRDIAPDNILMLSDSHPLLLDFGAARRAIAGMDQAFTVIVKQNYAPIEQYAELPGMSQGPWTDLFALAAVLHFAIAGQPPPPAVGRTMTDPYVPLAQRFAGQYSEGFLHAIDRTLAVKPADRPQSAAQLRAMMDLRETSVMHPHASTAPPDAALPAALQPQRRPALLLPLGGAVLLAVAIGAYVLSQRSPIAATPVTTPASAAAVQPAAVPAPAPAARAPFDPIVALRNIVDGASPDRLVSVAPSSPRLIIGRDALGFTVRASHAGYVYVLMVGTNRTDFNLLFPNKEDSNNAIKAGQTLTLPRKNWRVDVTGPAGVDQLVVIVSDAPRDFQEAGLVMGDVFGEFPATAAARLHDSYQGTSPLFAGRTTCDAAAAACSQTYGAGMFAVEEAMR